MIKNEEYKGFWFLPNKIEEKIPGILYFEANKTIRLELIGGFENNIKEIFNDKAAEIILGTSNKNEKISLLICNGYSNLNFSSEFQTTNYNCQYLIIGKHLSAIAELSFNKIQADLTYLYEWYPSGIIKNTIKFSEVGKFNETVVSINKNDSWRKIFEIDSGYNLTLCGVGNFNDSFDKSRYNFSQNTILEIAHNKSKKSFAELLNKLELFKQFLSLATLSSINYNELILFDNSDFQELKDGDKIFNPILLCFIENKESSINVTSYQFLFKYKDINIVFHDIIKEWYKSKKNLAPIRNHLIASIKPKRIFTSLDFLIVVQSLEGYHRRFIKRKIKVPKGESELNLRLNELINTFINIDKIKNTTINLKQVICSRNYYSHFFDKNENVLEGKELFFLTQQLRNLLICCVLNLIGFEISLINRLLNKNKTL